MKKRAAYMFSNLDNLLLQEVLTPKKLYSCSCLKGNSYDILKALSRFSKISNNFQPWFKVGFFFIYFSGLEDISLSNRSVLCSFLILLATGGWLGRICRLSVFQDQLTPQNWFFYILSSWINGILLPCNHCYFPGSKTFNSNLYTCN